MKTIQELFDEQQFENDYELVDGLAMHAKHPENFQIPPPVLKRHVNVGHFVELRIDSPRFSLHQDSAEQCMCPSCHGEMSKPILRHEQPASFVSIPFQPVPARGWGEDFWVRISDRSGEILRGVVDNALVEARLHGLHQGSEILFHHDHILGVHPVHRKELLLGMTAIDLKELAHWLRS